MALVWDPIHGYIDDGTGTPAQSQRGGLVQALTDLPAGSYDPNLLYQSQNANLGQQYAAGDYDTATGRINADYGLNTGRMGDDFNRQTGYLGEDYGRSTGRMGEDYQRSSGRLGEDYRTSEQRTNQSYDWRGEDTTRQHGRSLSDLLQNYTYGNEDRGLAYQRLGSQQTQAAGQRGLASGGALVQAMQKRQANQAREQGRADTAYGTATGRENEDYGTTTSRLAIGRSQDLGDLSRNYQRGGEDLSRSYTRGTEDAATDYGRSHAGLVTGYDRGMQDQGIGKDRGLADALTGYSRAGQSNALYQGGLLGTAAGQAQQYASQYGTPSGYLTYNGQLYKRNAAGQLMPSY